MQKSRSAGVQLTFISTKQREPTLSAKDILEIERAIADRINRNAVIEKSCSGAYCLSLNNGIKDTAAALFGLNLKCQKSTCSWRYDKAAKEWKRVCTVDCSGGGYTIKGTVGDP